MIMRIRLALLLGFVLLLEINSFGQKIKYKDFKNDVSTKNYQAIILNQKYSPLIAGVCNFVLPSAGYFYIGEPLRGGCVLGSELVTGSMFFYGLTMSMSVDAETGQAPKAARGIMLSGLIATGIIHFWSIYDVVKIAKVKNLVYQKKKLTINLKPELNITGQNSNSSVIYGLKLSVNF